MKREKGARGGKRAPSRACLTVPTCVPLAMLGRTCAARRPFLRSPTAGAERACRSCGGGERRGEQRVIWRSDACPQSTASGAGSEKHCPSPSRTLTTPHADHAARHRRHVHSPLPFPQSFGRDGSPAAAGLRRKGRRAAHVRPSIARGTQVGTVRQALDGTRFPPRAPFSRFITIRPSRAQPRRRRRPIPAEAIYS
jgi:hypothetical protein